MSKINTTYQELADYIFSFFSSCTAPGQGLFLFRTLNATTRKYGKTQAEINLCHIVIFNLLENGYLEAANEPSPFVRLTEKGFDYLQGDDLIKNQINLKEYIDLSKEDSNVTFNGLWTIIGIKDVAPFYVDGPTFFNTINPFVNVATNYSAYIQMLSDQKESTSRHTWFKTLFLRLKKSDIPSFLDDLSLSIYKYYDEISVNRTYFKDEFNIEEIDVHKFEMLCPNDEIKELCLSLIKTNPECDYFSSVNKSAVEVYLKKNTKGSAILKAIDFLDIKIENTYAFGDGKNDIEMLLTVGCGIAMGNANDEVKNHSNKITDTVQNDGVAKGIEQYVYID